MADIPVEVGSHRTGIQGPAHEWQQACQPQTACGKTKLSHLIILFHTQNRSFAANSARGGTKQKVRNGTFSRVAYNAKLRKSRFPAWDATENTGD
jgi:hypothetical protein